MTARIFVSVLFACLAIVGCEKKSSPAPEPAVVPPAPADKPAPKAEGSKEAVAKAEGPEGCNYAKTVAEATKTQMPHEACADAPAAKPTEAGKTNHYGSAFTLTDTVPLAKVLATAKESDGKMVRVSGTVQKVCKSKGCWFTLETAEKGATPVRITMKDHSFFVPTNSEGRKAVVEGLFKAIELPEAVRKHLAEDGKEDPSKIQGAATELTLVATAVDLDG